MNLLAAFFRLIRFSNLVFIAATQVLYYYGIMVPIGNSIPGAHMRTTPDIFWLVVAASVLIAAGGYIINDYFDLNIDRVNRPNQMVVEKMIKRRWAIVWHILLSFFGLAFSFYAGFRLGNPFVGLLNTVVVILLWFYSTTFKKQLLIGNVIISLLTAWVVLVLYVCESRMDLHLLSPPELELLSSIMKTAVLYGGFAFVISLIREIVKDMEDREGDARYQCRTMPIVWGLSASKGFVFSWMIVLAACVLILAVYAIQIHWWWLSVYLIFTVLLPLGLSFPAMAKAQVQQDFGRLSRRIKWIMLAGTLSMIFFKFYL